MSDDEQLAAAPPTHSGEVCRAQCANFRVAVAHEEMNPRRRNTMEDCHRMLAKMDEALPGHSFFSIYDGHGGRQIVDFLESALETNLVKELTHPDDASLQERVTRAFLITDMESRNMNITTSGATAVVSILFPDPSDASVRRLLVANVGDSRAVLATNHPPPSAIEDSESGFYGLRLTVDHRAEDKEEQARISAAGGFVARNRVLGILAVSRSFGDHGMKDFVVAAPHVTETAISSTEQCPFLILACDGVWDVLSDQEAVDLVMARYATEGPFENAAELLVDTAIEKGSSDNVTAIVVFL